MKIFSQLSLFFLLSSLIFCQNNITNTLGAGGTFTIKDNSTTFFTLSQSDGRITLPNTTSPSLGVVYKGTDRFMHDYKPAGGNDGNLFLGINSGNFTMTFSSSVDASGNTGIGGWTLKSLTTGYRNTACGFAALEYNTTGFGNTGIGYGALFPNTTGSRNTAVGTNSLFYQTTGNDNTAIGVMSLYSNSTGNKNTALGTETLGSNTTGFQNTAVGHHALNSNNGNYNTALGFNAGSLVTTGYNLTLIGIDANPTSATATNQITLGNTFVSSLRCNVQNISSLSDARDKKNIKDLNLGIDFLMKIKPRLFNWDKREWYSDNKSDGSKIKEEPTAGFIAQELDEVQTSENAEWLNLVLKDNPEKLEATSGNLLPIIVKAIQDLKKENDELKTANEKLILSNVELTSRLTKFEQIQNMLVTEIEKLKTNNYENAKVSLGDK